MRQATEHNFPLNGEKSFFRFDKIRINVLKNYFQGLKIYFQGLVIYFQGLIIYFQALKIIFKHVAQGFVPMRKGKCPDAKRKMSRGMRRYRTSQITERSRIGSSLCPGADGTWVRTLATP